MYNTILRRILPFLLMIALAFSLTIICSADAASVHVIDPGLIGIDLSRPDRDFSESYCKSYDDVLLEIKGTEPGSVVRLSAEDGSSPFTLEDVMGFHEASPGVLFDYSFSLFDQTVNLLDTSISYQNQYIGDQGVSVFYKILPMMPLCTRVCLDDCSIGNEVMAELRDAFPEKSIVWRVHWSGFSALTDVQTIRATNTVRDAGSDVLQYCTEVRFIDFGHNTELHNIDYMRYMPHLTILIIVDAPIFSLEPLSGCSELQLLEIVGCPNLTDLSPLASCENLRFLNFSNSHGIKDISPLYTLQHLERLYAARYSFPEAQAEEIRSLMPDCWVSFGMPPESRVSYNYSVGWRLDAAPNERSEWYNELREIFGVSQEFYSYHSYRNDPPQTELHVFLPQN